MAKTYYAVAKGVQPRIYESWTECQKQVNNYYFDEKTNKVFSKNCSKDVLTELTQVGNIYVFRV